MKRNISFGTIFVLLAALAGLLAYAAAPDIDQAGEIAGRFGHPEHRPHVEDLNDCLDRHRNRRRSLPCFG